MTAMLICRNCGNSGVDMFGNICPCQKRRVQKEREMSWGFGIGKTPAAEFDTAIDAAGKDFPAPTAEQAVQIAAAFAAAKAIFASGAVGREGEYIASMSGHAEPGHERRKGFSGDMVHVTVERYIDYEVEP